MSEEKITTKCTHCGQRMRVREIYVGKKIKCPQCGEAFYIEKLDESAEFGTESSPMTETELPNNNNANEESTSYPAGLSEFGESVQNDDVLSESDLGSDAEDIAEICLTEDGVEEAKIRVEKPEAISFVGKVGVEIKRVKRK